MNSSCACTCTWRAIASAASRLRHHTAVRCEGNAAAHRWQPNSDGIHLRHWADTRRTHALPLGWVADYTSSQWALLRVSAMKRMRHASHAWLRRRRSHGKLVLAIDPGLRRCTTMMDVWLAIRTAPVATGASYATIASASAVLAHTYTPAPV